MKQNYLQFSVLNVSLLGMYLVLCHFKVKFDFHRFFAIICFFIYTKTHVLISFDFVCCWLLG